MKSVSKPKIGSELHSTQPIRASGSTMQASRQESDVSGRSDYCDVCGLGPPPTQLSQSGPRSRQLSEYNGSAQNGCRACLAILRFISRQHWRPLPMNFDPFITYTQGMIMIQGASGHECEFFTLSHTLRTEEQSSCDHTLEHPWIQRMSEPSGCTSSGKCFDTLMQWISCCQTEHTICNSTRGNILPHRVLEIQSTQPLRVRVVEGGTRRGQYACLSHRWGPKTKSTSLNRSNLSLYKAMIPRKKFYPLTRDAIKIASKLNLRYIWIDAYCILQDSKEDWEKEAAEMGAIYENAFLTISANDSDKGHKIFSTSAPQSFHVTEVNGDSVFIRKRLNHPCRALYGLSTEIDSSVALSRAWIYQERILSRRFVHFTRDEIFWECRENTWCECGSGMNEWARPGQQGLTVLRYQRWEHIAEQYNTRELSYEDDRLPALAGVARRFAGIHGKTYLAGHWEEDLPASLGWCKSFYINALEPRPLHQTAPTWSWASLPRGQKLLCLYEVLHSDFIRLVGFNRKSPGADIYASARQTEIIVEGYVLGVEIYKQESLPLGYDFRHTRQKNETSYRPIGLGNLIVKAGQALLTVTPDFDMDPKDSTKHQVVADATSCLLLLLSGGPSPPFRVVGLLLLQRNSTNSTTAEFERIGYLQNMDLDHLSHLDESGKFTGYLGNRPFHVDVDVDENDLSPVSLAWLRERAEKRQVTLV